MHILRLLKTSDPESLKVTLFVTCLAGLSNAVLIGIINLVAEDVASDRPPGARMILLYLIAAATYFVANRASLRGANSLLQQRLGELKVRLADKIRRSELRVLERMGRGEIYATVAQETNHLSQNFPLIVGAGQSLFLTLFCLLYIATLSQISFIVICFCVLLGLLFFRSRRQGLEREMAAVHANEAAMLESLTHFAEGFQEIRLNADKNDALYARFRRIVDDLESVVVGIGGKWVAVLLFSNAFMYGLLGVVIFVLPGFFSGYTDIIYKIAAAAIFCIGPMIGATIVAPLYSRADVGLGHVFALEQRLDEGAPPAAPEAAPQASRFSEFQVIALEAITFRYEDAEGRATFATGPFDLELRRGDMVFLRGGNGSGKSTTLKLLCGLYRPASGRIAVDSVPVDDATLQDYRELFSAIFSDFHLFHRLHGLENVDPERVRALIARMELSEKVTFADGRFSTLDLSTGQRKRLAMIVSLLEDREICLFDEWAADQDEHFRDVFYTQLLPELKRAGKTIVAVTHDDRYWHVADRLITLDLGEIVPAQAGA